MLRMEDYIAIKALKERDVYQKDIAEQLGAHPKTVSRALRRSAWANAYWVEVRKRSHGDNDAYRRLGNRWLAIGWKLWQTVEVYDGAYHLRKRRLRRRPKS